jgi:predicted FMN-binding regulatory protein PaiB
MYQPDHFRVDDVPQMHALMRARPFAALVSGGSAGLYASHLPTVLKDDGPYGIIECHLARANPHWKDLAEGNEALMIFQGPEGYITPNWYPSKAQHGKVVPTWNFAVVHANGRPEVYEGQELAAPPCNRAYRATGEIRSQAMGAVGCARDLHRSHVARHRRLPLCHYAARRQVEDEPKSQGAGS